MIFEGLVGGGGRGAERSTHYSLGRVHKYHGSKYILYILYIEIENIYFQPRLYIVSDRKCHSFTNAQE